MIRTLLATTALSLLLSAGAIAQEAAPAAAPAATAPADAMAPADTMAPADKAAPADAMAPADKMSNMTPMDMAKGYVAADTDNLGTRLIGQPVYSSESQDAENIGNISDLVFTDDGRIAAVVIGVGGFLGIGEKSVAVDFSALDFTIAADNTERWVLPTTKDALTAAPDFVFKEDKPADATAPAAPDAMAPAAPDATAPAAPDAMAPAAPDAMAPAAAPATN